MDAKFDAVLARYQARLVAEHRRMPGERADFAKLRDSYLLAVGPEVGALLHALIVGRGAKHILELGTSYGYSTLFLADAARRTGGRVHTLDLSAEKQQFAQQQLSEAGLAAQVQWHCGDAVQLLRTLAGPFDLVLVDLWKDLYVPCLDLFYPKLADHAVIVADNMLQPEDSRPHAEAYRAAVRSRKDLQTLLLPIGNGIEVSCLWR